MPLAIDDLDDTWLPHVVAYLRRSPYRNALQLSNVTQLRQRCAVVLAHSNGLVQGVASHYRDLPFLGLTFVAELGETLPRLLEALANKVPALRTATLTAIFPEHRAKQLAEYVHIKSQAIAWQMVVEPETLRAHETPSVQRLRFEDLPAMNELATQCGLVAWRPDVFHNGPAFGVFREGSLAAMAATHFATPDVIEIGNIATHPDYRRQGLASACTSALASACFALAPRVYLMVMAENTAAYETYGKLGFWPFERFALVSFRLQNAPAE
ncbi:MAG: GNAT family N-acetyltransferase [Chloroflexales bacterium]|nr:GNAT family N-acetyltransferase [Chloroflexales bacterium]